MVDRPVVVPAAHALFHADFGQNRRIQFFCCQALAAPIYSRLVRNYFMSVVHQHQVGRRISPSFRHAGVMVERLSLVDRVAGVGLLGH